MDEDLNGFSNAKILIAKGIIDPRDFAGFSSKRITNPIDLTEVK